MKHRRSHKAATRDREIPVPLLCAKLGEDFELFSDRTDDAVECENLIHDLESIRDADLGALDIH
jgi:hypothetical protein